MGRRGNPYDNAKAESFMKTLKVEAVYLMDYRNLRGRYSRSSTLHRRGLQHPQTPHSALGYSKPKRNMRTATPGNLPELLA